MLSQHQNQLIQNLFFNDLVSVDCLQEYKKIIANLTSRVEPLLSMSVPLSLPYPSLNCVDVVNSWNEKYPELKIDAYSQTDVNQLIQQLLSVYRLGKTATFQWTDETSQKMIESQTGAPYVQFNVLYHKKKESIMRALDFIDTDVVNNKGRRIIKRFKLTNLEHPLLFVAEEKSVNSN